MGELLLSKFLSSADAKDVYVLTCYALCRIGQVSRAEAWLRDRTEDWVDYARAVCLFSRGNTQGLREGLAKLHGDEATRVRDYYEILVRLDETSSRWPKRSKAIAEMAAPAQINPESAEDLQEVLDAIEFFVHVGDHDQELHLSRQLAEQSESLFHHLPYISALFRRDEREEVAAAWDQILSRAPQSFFAHQYAAANLQRLKRFGEAGFLLHQAVQLAPTTSSRGMAEAGLWTNRLLTRFPFLTPRRKGRPVR